MKKISVLFILFCMAVFPGCSGEQPDCNLEKEEVAQILDDFWRAIENKDFDRLSEIIAHDTDMVFFGTDENERWAGWEVVKEALQKQFTAFKSIKIQTNNTIIHVSSSCQTAWFSLQRFIEIETQDAPKSGMKNRVTGVFGKREGQWRMVQYHCSYPLTNWQKFKY